MAAGLKPEGLIIVNEEKSLEELGLKARVVTVPASRIARDIIGRADRGNTALLGAFAAATGEISLETLKKAVSARFQGEARHRNLEALEQAYDLIASKPGGSS